ncbi:type II toxin-antitoxin system RelE/ParE family toxin [Patescibacteria group bacterium]|nr:type II toxin-antitoxin system RelE/ParE family toxin [Patescibacteria group bacterium]MBU1124338.1 type II toxin-antitoxin system RelE/ParE family toxin [Patescibacteria group bacterium]MBU1911218.1 type II toxin-antitoxin system RelE/ParE family toxin [Patescibacteria group bacterium]
MEIKLFDKNISDFIADLDKTTMAKALRTLDLLEKFGNKLSMPHSKNIGDQLFELRIHGKKEVRLIYCFDNNKVIILHGLIKKSQKTPKRHIKLAKKHMNSIDLI